MVKILQAGLTASYGGTESVIRNQFAALDHSRVQYWFVNENANLKTAYTDEFLSGGARIVDFPGRRKHPVGHYLAWVRVLFQLRHEIDGIVFNANSYKFVVPMFISWLMRIPIRVCHAHAAGGMADFRISAVNKVASVLNRCLVRFFCTEFFAISGKAADWMFGPDSPYEMVYNAIRAEDFAFDEAVRSEYRKRHQLGGRFVIGLVGNYLTVKNHAFALELMRTLKEKMPESLMLFAGDVIKGSPTTIRDGISRTIDEEGLSSHVRMLGRVSDVNVFLQVLDCLIVPSTFEGLSLAAIEAQAAGLPCILSDRLPCEVQVNENCQFLSIDKGVDEWVDAIRHQAKVDRVALSKHFAASKFNIKNSIEDLMAYYERKAGER